MSRVNRGPRSASGSAWPPGPSGTWRPRPRTRCGTSWPRDTGGTVEAGRGLYLWCGTDFGLADAVFAPAETEHGTFVTHAYPYSDGQSTFLIETDEQTWRRAGFEATTEQTPSDASDLASLRYLQQA